MTPLKIIFSAPFFRAATFAVACVFTCATASAENAENTPPPEKKIAALPAPVPFGATLGDADPEVRAAVLRKMIYAGEAQKVLAHLQTEKDTGVIQAALFSLGNAQVADAGEYISAQCGSNDTAIAAAAFRAAGALKINAPQLVISGLNHAEADIRQAALQAASQVPFNAGIADAVLKLTNDTAPANRQIAVRAAIKIQAARADGAAGTPDCLQLAGNILDADANRAPDVLIALLAQRIRPDAAIGQKLAALTPEQHRQFSVIYSAFPDQTDDDLLRFFAQSQDRAIADIALPLLARKSSLKTEATVQALSEAISKAPLVTLERVLPEIDADLEFTHVAQIARRGVNEETPLDPFAGPTTATESIATGRAYDTEILPRYQRTHIGKMAPPSFQSITHFFGILQNIAKDARHPERVRDEATLTFQKLAHGLQMLDVIHTLLDNTDATVRKKTATVALDQIHDPRYIEAVLIAAQKNDTPFTLISDPQLLAPYLAINNAGTARILSRAANLLLEKTEKPHRLLALALLSEHGTPTHAARILPLINDTDPQIRRAAWHTLSRVSPEIFFLRISELQNDTDASVRATLPLAFFKVGYRWEHILSDTATLAHWTRPRPEIHFPDNATEILNTLANDTDAQIRMNSLLAIIQHGGAIQDDILQANLPPRKIGETALPGAQILHARKFETMAPKNRDPVDGSALKIFVRPRTNAQIIAENATYRFRQIQPQTITELFYRNDNFSDEALAYALPFFPVSPAQEMAPVLVFSSGAWWSGDTLDVALLMELAEYGLSAEDADLLGKAAPPAPVEATFYQRFPKKLLFALIGGGIIGLTFLGVGLFFAIRFLKRRHAAQKALERAIARMNIKIE